jgi:TonB family protein
MRTSFFVACILLLTSLSVQAQDTISQARDLYTAANYEGALGLLSRLDSPSNQPSDRLVINQYRAFCLLALGRTPEAEQAIEAVVMANPLYRPAEADASPRLLSAFSKVRQRMLPTLVQREYASAKAAFDRQDFATAVVAFDRALQGLHDPDLGDAGGRPPLADLRTLANGFRELSARAAAPPPEPTPAPVVVAPPPIRREVYTTGDMGVTAPVTLHQEMPPFMRAFGQGGDGVLEIVINQAGGVESATMRSSVNPRYDVNVLTATKNWKYAPATVDGTPVKFRKVISIAIKPAG